MISILKKSKQILISAAVAAVVAGVPLSTLAQSSLSLSVTPTLFEMSADRGQIWKSSVKVVNSNSFPITVYANPVNFAPQGEAGQGKLLPVLEELSDGATLAEWITVTAEAIDVPPESSKEVSFIVEVPESAPPGGHFAAILIGTQPPEIDRNRMQVRTSQVVSSLFFLRIEGDVVEDGTIRSFTTEESFVDVPNATFALRFENKGNIHLQPQGSIDIYNMWGKRRGTIPINHQTNFGNVLPESVRKFSLRWEGSPSFADIGRYRADVALGYGADGRKFVTDSTYFWVVPVKAGLITLGFIIAFIWFVSWAIKAYVRRMLSMAGVAPERIRRQMRIETSDSDIKLANYKTVSAPVRFGISDLMSRLRAVPIGIGTLRALVRFVLVYRIFFLSVSVLLVAVVLIWWFLQSATQSGRDYEVAIDNGGTEVVLNSEEIAFEEALRSRGAKNEEFSQSFTVTVVNTSGVVGTAASVGVGLVSENFEVTELTTDPERLDKRSVVVFDPVLQAEALAISQLLGGALLSATDNQSTTTPGALTIYTGLDQVTE